MDRPRPRAIVAEDHDAMRDLITRVLAEDCDIVASVANGKELMDAVDSIGADLLIVDVSMPLVNGLEALRTIRSHGISTPAVIVTNSVDPAVVEESLRIGATCFVVKDRLAVEFRPAVQAALRGRRFVSPLRRMDDWTPD